MWHTAERREGLPRLDARYACEFSPLPPLSSCSQLTARTRSHVLCAATPRGDDRHLLRCFRQDLGERHGRARVQTFRRRARYRYQPRVGPCFAPFLFPCPRCHLRGGDFFPPQRSRSANLQQLITRPFLLQDAPYRTTILDPLGKMNSYFPTINEHISKRNKKVSGASVLVP
jgi:hypothetical protein